MSGPTYARVADTVWRLAADRVIVRHASIDADDTGVDVTGLAALVWVALDEPASVDELAVRLAAEEFSVLNTDVSSVVGQLGDAGWVRRIDELGTTG